MVIGFELFFTSNVELTVDLPISAKTNVEFVTSQMGASSCDGGLKGLRLGDCYSFSKTSKSFKKNLPIANKLALWS